jgi:hypothetical protein
MIHIVFSFVLPMLTCWSVSFGCRASVFVWLLTDRPLSTSQTSPKSDLVISLALTWYFIIRRFKQRRSCKVVVLVHRHEYLNCIDYCVYSYDTFRLSHFFISKDVIGLTSHAFIYHCQHATCKRIRHKRVISIMTRAWQANRNERMIV